uniref:Uncharacterized protein n=1 Tax=Sphaerodactylus townsendi TaxID=933632 RepID=A0ACB8EDX4_9SAUR
MRQPQKGGEIFLESLAGFNTQEQRGGTDRAGISTTFERKYHSREDWTGERTSTSSLAALCPGICRDGRRHDEDRTVASHGRPPAPAKKLIEPNFAD